MAVIRWLLLNPRSTKYTIEKGLRDQGTHIRHESLYHAVDDLKHDLIHVVTTSKSRAGKKMEYYSLTIRGLFHGLRLYFFPQHETASEGEIISRVAKNYGKELPEILGQWKHFVDYSKRYRIEQGLPSVERCAISNLSNLVTFFPYLEYGWEDEIGLSRMPKVYRKLERQTKEDFKTLAIRIFIFGRSLEDPNPINWTEPWVSAISSNPVLSKWASKIAKGLWKRYGNAQVKWESIFDELETAGDKWD